MTAYGLGHWFVGTGAKQNFGFWKRMDLSSGVEEQGVDTTISLFTQIVKLVTTDYPEEVVIVAGHGWGGWKIRTWLI